jgi:hypothetical protein
MVRRIHCCVERTLPVVGPAVAVSRENRVTLSVCGKEPNYGNSNYGRRVGGFGSGCAEYQA